MCLPSVWYSVKSSCVPRPCNEEAIQQHVRDTRPTLLLRSPRDPTPRPTRTSPRSSRLAYPPSSCNSTPGGKSGTCPSNDPSECTFRRCAVYVHEPRDASTTRRLPPLTSVCLRASFFALLSVEWSGRCHPKPAVGGPGGAVGWVETDSPSKDVTSYASGGTATVREGVKAMEVLYVDPVVEGVRRRGSTGVIAVEIV